GTEPKLKCYYEVISDFPADMSYEQAQQTAEAKMNALIDAHQKKLVTLSTSCHEKLMTTY
ncbi:hypothetical protein HJ114_25145, partial [Vibrio parahaemolyticus]|nr:hypothetical protein [Vibrio parahaemolyticus]MBE4112237.1 hypothetical protein [Vibrio parahaemolyticus]